MIYETSVGDDREKVEGEEGEGVWRWGCDGIRGKGLQAMSLNFLV